MRDRGSTIVFSTHQMEMVEELCETVALIDRGRVVLGGPSGGAPLHRPRVIRLGGRNGRTQPGCSPMAWLPEVPGVRVARARPRTTTEVDVERDVDPETVLRAALDRGKRVTRFLIDDPSIEEIFIERVGRRPTEEQHLGASGRDWRRRGPPPAAAPRGRSLATGSGSAALPGARPARLLAARTRSPNVFAVARREFTYRARAHPNLQLVDRRCSCSSAWRWRCRR